MRDMDWDKMTYDALQEDSAPRVLTPNEKVLQEVETLKNENASLQESIAEVRAMMSAEDQGWALIGGVASGERLEGLDISEVQTIAGMISPRVAASGMPRRAADLHAGFVWGRGCYIEGTEKPKGRGAPSKLRRVYVDPRNQASVFSDISRTELQKERFITGNVLVAVDTAKNSIDRIPFNQIIQVKVDPDFPERSIAYLRQWDTQDGTTNSVKKLWYYTKRYSGTRQKSFTTNNETIKIAQGVTIVDLRANRQVGHVLGIPDGLAGMMWSEAYGEIIQYGRVVNESLAKILFRVTNKTKSGVQSTGVKMSGFSGHGGTASMVEGQELTAVSTAGRGYDFAAARPVAAMAAMSWNVSNMDLLSDSSAAGSSYGSASALVPANRNAMLLMQKEWADFYKDIFEVLASDRPTIVFEPFEAPDKYRELQAITLGSVALSDEEYRMAVLDALDIVGNSEDIPELLKMRSIDRNANNSGVQQSAPDQGISNGTNSAGQGANDQRSDTISSQEALRREMAMSGIVDKFENLVQRAEASLAQ